MSLPSQLSSFLWLRKVVMHKRDMAMLLMLFYKNSFMPKMEVIPKLLFQRLGLAGTLALYWMMSGGKG